MTITYIHETQLFLAVMFIFALKSSKFYVCCKLSRNQPTGLCFHNFAMIRPCAYLFK